MFRVRVIEFKNPAHARAELERAGVESAARPEHLAKGQNRAVWVERISPTLAQFLLQELALEGGDALVAPQGRAENSPAELETGVRLDSRTEGDTAALLLGTPYQLQHLAVRLRTQDAGELNLLADELERALAAFQGTPPPLAIGSARLEWGRRTYVMGILNLTPDSFSGDGLLSQSSEEWVEQAVARALALAAEGADILDIGGESTRPGSQPVPAEEEYRRVIPVLNRLRPLISIPISVDTYKAEIARAAIDAGADLVNDVWGLRMDPQMKGVVAERGVPIVIMHNRSRPKDAAQTERLGGRYVGVEYGDLMGEVVEELRGQIDLALDAGIARDKIIVDPGIGFGKTVEQNLELLNRLDELRALGYPVLLGVSRKGFIGYTLDVPAPERVEGTAAAVALGIARGADIVRVHDVRAMVRVSKMADAIVRERPPTGPAAKP